MRFEEDDDELSASIRSRMSSASSSSILMLLSSFRYFQSHVTRINTHMAFDDLVQSKAAALRPAFFFGRGFTAGASESSSESESRAFDGFLLTFSGAKERDVRPMLSLRQ